VYVNLAFERMSQSESDELIGRTVWEAAPELLGTPFEKRLRDVMRERRPARLEFGGERATFDIQAMPFADGMAFFANDITALRKATDEIRQKEERFRAILNTEPGC